MVLEELSLRDFRNIEELSIKPDASVNVIYGDNAQGKTNLIEAIWLLTGQRSFRTGRDADMIRFGQPRAEISAQFFSGGRQREISLTLGAKKTAELGGVGVAPSELSEVFLAVVFSPGELSLVQDGPSARRAFLDGAISQVMPRYPSSVAALARVTQQRNNLLAELVRGYGDIAMLDIWDRSLARYSYSVINARRRFINRLSAPAAREFADIGGEELSIGYISTMQTLSPWDTLDPKRGEQELTDYLRSIRGEDIRACCSTAGPHRDDIDFRINGLSARLYGSQGQQRSCALALKLAQCRVMEDILGEAPIVLLDDVLSELDKRRRSYLLSGVSAGQVFITACDRSILRTAGGKLVHLKGGKAVKRR